MAITLNLHPRTIWVAKQLARRPEFYWEKLSYEDKKRVYEAPLTLDTVPDEMVNEFRSEMAKNGEFGVGEQVKEITRSELKELTEQ